jgi:hypothetical protein
MSPCGWSPPARESSGFSPTPIRPLAVVGRADGEPMQRFAGPVGVGLVDHASCSILVVPAQTLAEPPAGSNVAGSKAQRP